MEIFNKLSLCFDDVRRRRRRRRRWRRTRRDASANIARLKAPLDYGGTIIANDGDEDQEGARKIEWAGRQEGSL